MDYRTMQRLNITEVNPEGWLKQQLITQMNGLTGCLYDVWDSVGSYSGWLGNSGENWERAPYYLDGLIPLAYYLSDEKRWAICERFMEWTLASQDESGSFGPVNSKDDYWSRFVMLKAVIQYGEITDVNRVLDFCRRYFDYVADRIDQHPFTDWSKARVPELLWTMKWVYERTGDESIPRLARIIDEKSLDWADYFATFPFPRQASWYMDWKKFAAMDFKEYGNSAVYHATHIVNVAMGIKHPALKHYFTGNDQYQALTRKAMDELKEYHGVASGCINGDEHLSSNDPNRGSELCSVVEYMFSLLVAMEEFGDPYLGDQMERLAYNALPATITEDFMAHQYLQQANQVMADKRFRPWFNNGDDSTTFGLEPNFGCCTANMHQGWPKFVNSLWYKQGNDTLVSMVFAPNSVKTEIGGENVEISLETDYPFDDTLRYRFTASCSRLLTLSIRIPSWCSVPKVECPGAEIDISMERRMISVKKAFRAGETVTVTYPMEVYHTHWFKNSLAVERGPLVFALNMKERWEILKEIAGVKDYSVLPESPWNFALDAGGEAEVLLGGVSDIPFSKENPPVRLKVNARRLKSWQLDQYGNAGTLPQSPVDTVDPKDIIELIPFGCTKLRISQFPYFTK